MLEPAYWADLAFGIAFFVPTEGLSPITVSPRAFGGPSLPLGAPGGAPPVGGESSSFGGPSLPFGTLAFPGGAPLGGDSPMPGGPSLPFGTLAFPGGAPLGGDSPTPGGPSLPLTGGPSLPRPWPSGGLLPGGTTPLPCVSA